MHIKITGDGLPKFEKVVEALGSKAARALYRSEINKQGALLRKDAVRILPGQVGLVKNTIQRALKDPVRATNGQLRYQLTTRGGYISQKFFNPVERGSGVFAYPRSEAIFKHQGFLLSGRSGRRIDPGLGGHVFQVIGGDKETGKRSAFPGSGGRSWYRPIEKQISDVRIPDELTTGKMKRAYDKHADQLEPRLFKAIKTKFPGTF